MAASTNLALRPFRNERLPWLLASLLLASALLISVLHGRLIGRLLAGDEANTVRAVRVNEEKITELEDRIRKEPPLQIAPAEALRLRAYKDLVDRRVFPWRRLLTELEATLGDNVRLSRIAPATSGGVRGLLVVLSGMARTKDAAFSLAESLDASPAFSNAALSSLSEGDDGVAFSMEVVFEPPSASPAVEESTVPTPSTSGPPESGSGRRP